MIDVHKKLGLTMKILYCICRSVFFFFHWLIYNAHHSESKHVMQLEGGGGETTLRMVMCERVSYVCGSCCVDSCQ